MKAMLRRTDAYDQFERRWLARPVRDIEENFRILDALWAEAVALGAFGGGDLLAGIEVDIRVAKVWNCVPRAAGADCPGT
jgi:hypothetical protein